VFTLWRGNAAGFEKPVLCDVCIGLLAVPGGGTPHPDFVRVLADTWNAQELLRQRERGEGAVRVALAPGAAWAALALIEEMIGYRAELRETIEPERREQLEGLIDERATAIKRYLDTATG
jgi:hypothetical protein